MLPKVRKTLTLDVDLVETFSVDDADGFSASVNTVLRQEKERRARAESLRLLADELDAQFGPADAQEVAQAMSLLA
jgi:hypothetical protein